MNQYGKIEYWEERYSKRKEEEFFDWYQRFVGIKDILITNCTNESKILNVGSGNSRLSIEMFDEGYHNITNIDFSQTVITNMQEKFKDKGQNFKYLLMDVRAMDFQDNSFDCVIDKGTLDSVLCGDNSTANTHKMLLEISRILCPRGIYIIISYQGPENRENIIKKPEYGWDLTVKKVPKVNSKNILDEKEENVHFVYICQKN